MNGTGGSAIGSAPASPHGPLAAFAVTGEPQAVAAELTRRYGKLFTRCVLHIPCELGPDVFAEIAAGIRSGAGLRDESPAGAGS